MEASGQRKEVSVLLPVYNEAMHIEKCIQEIKAVLSCLSSTYEIIISEDGSTDGTDLIVRSILPTNPNLRLLHSDARLGKGKALKKAIREAAGDIIVFMDADLSTSLNYLPKVLQAIRDQDGLAIASRHVEGSVVQRRPSRAFFSLAYNLFVRLLFFDGIRDHQCGFKAMSRKAAKAVLDTKSNGFFFDTEMILRCKKQGFSVVEIGVVWAETRRKGESKVSLFRDAKRIGLDLLMFRLSSK